MAFQGENLHNPLVLAQGGLQSSQLDAEFLDLVGSLGVGVVQLS